MNRLELSEKIAKEFKSKENGFSDPKIFEAQNVGFSTQKKLDDDDQKKLAIKEDKEYTTLIHFSLNEEALFGDQEKIPVFLRAGFVWVRDDGFYIDDKYIKNKSYKPIDLTSTDDFFYNLKKNTFSFKGQQLDINGVINRFYSNHVKTMGKINGFLLRSKIRFWRVFLPNLIKFTSYIFKYSYQIISGNKISYPILERQVKIEESKTVGGKFEFYGYEASKQTIFIYSLIHLISVGVLLLFCEQVPRYLRIIFENNFLILTYAVTTLTIFDKVVPTTLEFLYEKTQRFYYMIVFKKIKV